MKHDDGIPEIAPTEFAARLAADEALLSARFAEPSDSCKRGATARPVVELAGGEVFASYRAAGAKYGTGVALALSSGRPHRGRYFACLTPALSTRSGRIGELRRRKHGVPSGARIEMDPSRSHKRKSKVA